MNPRHHLHESTLIGYAAGALAPAMAIVASAHLEQCAHCRRAAREAEGFGAALLDQAHNDPLPQARRDALRAQMLARLGSQDDPAETIATPHPRRETSPAPVAPDADRLPHALQPYFGSSYRALRWRWMAPGVHCLRAADMPSLIMLRIAPGKSLPMHSHGRSELTHILQGAYNDSLGLFAPGDVADLDQDVEHQPVTAPGVPCICVSALDAPLVFSGWLARKIQRFVKL
ncbi:transcriptional regulator [Stenotrophomonas panacihumi]|uniref:Transcriptional regulator n=1 Tax=Stenotrophomonas panacihumi TaxID=676599 RepID=A0A0R0AEP8_9GAMM|nr:ChrR family anti-sigma-E factor [Stenotrophomonas panacihumi]KRG43279.1 transcriptional regulator [Stenotrophomonas panacihumi]PTN55663.1 transcriptional regulator [Stenotrophomonas panacihumi]